MSAPDDFVAMILTHGRPDRVTTYRILREYRYTGPVLIVVDDEDETADRYREVFGEEVRVFSKKEIAERFDEADNFQDRRSVFYARNAAFDIAEREGYRYFIQLDDDYNSMYFRFNSRRQYGAWRLQPLDEVFAELLDYFKGAEQISSLCIAQGGDHIGGAAGDFAKAITTRRKAMNTFICDTRRRFSFLGRVNEDVNTYVAQGRRGALFLTLTALQTNQAQTQKNDGGMTALYRDSGTYTKSFYTVMMAPSCVKVAEIGTSHRRVHHAVNWQAAVPMILREEHRKPRGGAQGSRGAARSRS